MGHAHTTGVQTMALWECGSCTSLPNAKGRCQEEIRTKGSEAKTDDKNTVRNNLQPNANLKTALTAFNEALSWTELCSSDEESDF